VKMKIVFALLCLIPMISVADVCKTTTPINTAPYAADIGTRKVTFLAVDLNNHHYNNDGAFEGWYVGYVKDANAKPVAAFGIYMEAESFAAVKDYRKAFSLMLLEDLGIWE
jgi:hypothetical protein